MKEKVKTVRNAFIENFRNKGYIRNECVKISSGIDESVTFVGSGISVLKPKLLHQTISSQGEFITQKAIRTQSLKDIYNVDKINEYYSYFEALCALRQYNDISVLIKDTFDYLRNQLRIDDKNIKIKISTDDIDLLQAVKDNDLGKMLETDTMELDYYRHKYGLDEQGIYGRNFNIAILDKSDMSFKDIGNIIAIESTDKPYACEFAVGVQPIVMRTNGLNLSIESSYIADILSLETPEKIKFAECLVIVANLIYEDILDIKKRYPVYLFKKYHKAMNYWAEKLEFNSEEVAGFIESYLRLEYNKPDISIKSLKLMR